jgi:predicted nucleic acid-binding protein
VIVADTSAWAELFRQTGGRVGRALDRALDRPEDVAVTEVVVMELLAGARSPRHHEELRDLLLGLPLLRLRGLSDFERAAALFQMCRAGGETVRNLLDCLVAVTAIDAGAPVLHADADFDAIARHTPLEVVPLDG